MKLSRGKHQRQHYNSRVVLVASVAVRLLGWECQDTAPTVVELWAGLTERGGNDGGSDDPKIHWSVSPRQDKMAQFSFNLWWLRRKGFNVEDFTCLLLPKTGCLRWWAVGFPLPCVTYRGGRSWGWRSSCTGRRNCTATGRASRSVGIYTSPRYTS